jgi:hypothetical protein
MILTIYAGWLIRSILARCLTQSRYRPSSAPPATSPATTSAWPANAADSGPAAPAARAVRVLPSTTETGHPAASARAPERAAKGAAMYARALDGFMSGGDAGLWPIDPAARLGLRRRGEH